MKRKSWSMVAAGAALLCSLGGAVPATAGGVSGNGGDGIVLQFKFITDLMLKSLNPGINISKEAYQRVVTATRETTIESTSKTLKVDGVLKDAINNPEKKRIWVNRERWRNHSEPNQLLGLVLHEYLGIARIDDRDYQVSGPIFGRPQTPGTRFLKALQRQLVLLDLAEKGGLSGQGCYYGGEYDLTWISAIADYRRNSEVIELDRDKPEAERRPEELVDLGTPLFEFYCDEPNPADESKLRERTHRARTLIEGMIQSLGGPIADDSES